MDRGTIFALSSAPGRSGVAVIRISGREAGPALTALAGNMPAPRYASLRSIRDPASGEPLDRGIVLWFPGPESFTGEDVAELHIHGGRAVVTAVLDALDSLDHVAPAQPGDFTRRAFENGRLDLVGAEGLADLVVADTQAQRRQAIQQMSGEVSALYDGWRDRLIRELAYFEAQIDFPDEGDVPEDLVTASRRRVAALAAELGRHLDDGRRGERLRDGVRIVIAGEPNAGKSSLLNQLARRDVAIVSEEAGTTRDVIEVQVDLGGVAAIVADTAGLRIARGRVETEGVRRAEQRIADADVVVAVFDGSADIGACRDAVERARASGNAILVANKSDLFDISDLEEKTAGWDGPLFAISARTGEGLDAVIEALTSTARDMAGTGEDIAVTRLRHRRALEDCRDALERTLGADPDFPELAGEDLRRAVHALARVTGRVDVEDLLGAIFADFCIGK